MMNDVWMRTYTGSRVHILRPRPEEIHIIDIAHALSNTCRFCGHVPKFYSVAQHSLLVAEAVPDTFRLWGLLHDASEAYLHDLTRPLKRNLPAYAEIEGRMMDAICIRFGLPLTMPAQVKEADNAVLATEFRDLYHDALLCAQHSGGRGPLTTTIHPWSSDHAEDVFLAEFENLARRAA